MIPATPPVSATATFADHRSNLEDGSRIEFNLAPHGKGLATGPVQQVEPEQNPRPTRSIDLSPLQGIPNGPHFRDYCHGPAHLNHTGRCL